jgi:hypothetical protein
MIDREKRIKRHLKRIDEFTPAKQDKKASAVSLGSSSGTVKKYDLLAASYLREMVEKRVFKRGDRYQDEKATLRLQSYIQNLRRIDRNFIPTITAISAQSTSWGIIRNIIPLIAARVILVVIFAFLILNPTALLQAIVVDPNSTTGGGFLQFPALTDSIELTQPEFRSVILFNVLLFILAFSALIHFLLVHKPEVTEKEVKKVETLVDFREISEVATEEVPSETREES